MRQRVIFGARLGAFLAVAMLMAIDAGATTIAQNSSWTVTRPGATQTLRIVAYGDSIFAGYTNATTVARRAAPYVAAEYCAALLGQNVQVHRRCQSGGVAQDIYNRINSATDRAFMQDAATRIVTFEMCGNDYLQARSNFKSATGTCNYNGLNNALSNCQTYTQLAMDRINTFAHANTRLKIVANLYYPGFNADNSFSTCTDAVNGDPANGNRVNMQNLFLPRLLESNWWTCKYAEDKGFLCADAFAQYMARDYDSNGDGLIDSDAIRYLPGESLASYQQRVLALRGTLRDANFKLVNTVSSFDYIQSDDTHPTFEGATGLTLITAPGGSNPVFHATAGAYPDGKNPRWNQNGHDRMGFGLNPGCPFVAPNCGNGAIDTEWLPSGTPSTEECDDQNLADGDGCSTACGVEEGYFCSGAPSICAPICGDGLVTGPEQCDDGNAVGGDGCTETCTVEPGFSCMGFPSACETICGDGLLVSGEGCDDGNLDADDGCSSFCVVEEGWSCSGEASVCAPICGDSLILGTETCDEGEGTGIFPSCCSASCNPEPNGTPCDDGDLCTVSDVCDGDTSCGGSPKDCDDGNPCTDDSCDPSTGGCLHTNNTDPCDDGSVCTTVDTCSAGACVGAAPLSCDDGNECTDDSCDPEAGCRNDNNTAPCSDGDACTAPDVCSLGSCVGGAPVYSFVGFQQPIDNLPSVNVGKAGRSYPVKWQLPLCSGGYVNRLDVVRYNPLRLRQVGCVTNAPEEELPSDTPGASGLTYDVGSNQYHYNWKTSSAFADKCYELLLELDDGTTQVARFKFTK